MSGDSLATIIVALVMSLPGLFALFKQLKKEKAEAEKLKAESETEEANATEKIQAAALKMMEVYRSEFEALKCKITNLEDRVKELEFTLKREMEEKKAIVIGAWKLHDQVRELNGTPKYVPPKHKEE